MKPSSQKPIRDDEDCADNKSNESGRQPSKRVRKQPRKYENFHSDEVVLPKTEETTENVKTAASPDVEVKEEIEETSSAANEPAEKRKRGRPPNRTRDEDRIFCCEVCGKTFRQPGVFRVHKRIHTGEKPYQCEHCGMSFSQVGTLRDHQKIHTGERPYGCDFCPSRFTNKTRLTRHLRTHTGERPYKCDFCQMDFTSKSVLDKHRRVHTGEKPFQCEECGMAFTQRSTFVNHCKAHKGQRKRYPQRLLFYFCKPCSRHYPNVEKLYNHVCIPSGQHPEGTYNCKDCPRKFLSEESLESHMSETHSPEADNTQECVACNARFTNFDEFVEHVTTHGKSAPLPSSSAEPPAAVFACLECGKECTTKAQLSIHQRIHSGEKPFLCHFCSKTFRYRQNLREHLNSHMGKRPYACDQCNKSFSFSANLSTHKLTHKENKGRCRFCNKSFRSSAKLKAHEDAHSQAEGEDFSEVPPDAIATMAVDDDGESYLVISVEESTFS